MRSMTRRKSSVRTSQRGIRCGGGAEGDGVEPEDSGFADGKDAGAKASGGPESGAGLRASVEDVGVNSGCSNIPGLRPPPSVGVPVGQNPGRVKGGRRIATVTQWRCGLRPGRRDCQGLACLEATFRSKLWVVLAAAVQGLLEVLTSGTKDQRHRSPSNKCTFLNPLKEIP